MNFRVLILSSAMAFTLNGCKTSSLKSTAAPVKADVYRVWIEPSYAKSLRTLNGPTVRYQRIEIPSSDSQALKGHHGGD